MSRLAVIAVLGLALASGCHSKPAPVAYAREFPKDLQQDEVLNIQVFKDAKTIEFTNTTGREFGPCTLWLNARFSRPIDRIAVGETIKVPLADFKDQWQDEFRGGGFFATQRPTRLVLAQIETPRPDILKEGEKSRLIGLVVVRGEDD